MLRALQRTMVDLILPFSGKKPRSILCLILLPRIFQGALHGFLKGKSLIESVRMTIQAGGYNGSRAIQVGAICGTLSGEKAIPQGWIQ